jgi:hypothetical protein
MTIPKEFKLFNQTIKVIYKKNLIDSQGAFGVWDYSRNKIYLQPSTRKHILTKEQIDATFLHEVTYACLDLMGEHKMSGNEKFVHSFSNLLHQFILALFQ